MGAGAEITFANFSPSEHVTADIYRIGETAEHQGVIPEIAQAFEYELTDTPDVKNLGGLIGKVGPAKELQANIAQVQEVLGTNNGAHDIARGWVLRSGLLVPVQRVYEDLEEVVQEHEDIEAAAITGGIRNWMMRRAIKLAQLSGKYAISRAFLIGGMRAMKVTEGSDVTEGMTEADYLDTVVREMLGNIGVEAQLIPIESEVGDEVMEQGAAIMAKNADFRAASKKLLVVSNAGAWPQNAGQMARAFRTSTTTLGIPYRNIIVASDKFKAGESGSEPTFTHQSVYSAAGQIVRNAQELARHTPERH